MRIAPERKPGALARASGRAMLALVALALAACAGDEARPPPQARIEQAALVAGPALAADLRLQFSATMLEALDRGIPLTLALELRADAVGAAPRRERRTLELRYLPLAQQYQWYDRANGIRRNFPRRTQLLAALDHVRIALPADWDTVAPGTALVVSLQLDRRALPGPLRLPALLAREWRLPQARYAWLQAG